MKILFLIKLMHTLIWLVLSSTVLYVVWSGLSGNATRLSWIAVMIIIAEGIVLTIFNGKCPLTVVARKYSDSQKDNFDIFLPNWFAKYNKIICTSLFFIGLILIILQYVKIG